MGTRVQAVEVGDDGRTWTVLGEDHRCVGPIEEFLEYHRVIGSSPNTVRSYAKGLQLWWAFLAEAGLSWEDPGVEMLRGFLTWLTSGLAPSVSPLQRADPVTPKVAEATVSARLAAVVSFCRYHHDLHGRGRLIALASTGPARRGRYQPMLAHLDGRRRRPAAPLRLHRPSSGPPPLFTPAQVRAILDGCATFDTTLVEWRGSLRDRLLFATLVETGMRLGEALCLTHADWRVGRGETPFVEVVPKAHPHGQRVKGGRHVARRAASDRGVDPERHQRRAPRRRTRADRLGSAGVTAMTSCLARSGQLSAARSPARHPRRRPKRVSRASSKGLPPTDRPSRGVMLDEGGGSASRVSAALAARQ